MPSLTSLAEELLAQARKVDQALEQSSLPYPSFDNDSLELLPQSAQKLRRELLDTSHNIRQLARGPRLSGQDIALSWTEQVILRIIWRYKIASAIPPNGTATYSEISTASGLSGSLVVRIIRAAIPLNIFNEPKSGHICHTAISRLLAENDLYYNSIGLQLEDLGPASLKLMDAWETFGADAGESNQSAFSLSNGGRSLFTVLAEEPERAHRFNSAMKYVVEDKEWDFFDITKAFDWSSLDTPGSWVIDLGDGYSQVAQAVAKHTHHLAFTVQELSHVVEQGKQKLPEEFAGRISFEEHSFMEPQPAARVPNAFLISRCLHNWSDHHASAILRALTPALRKGSKVLIWDSVLPEKAATKFSERFNLQQDFIMATIFSGKDRTAAEFRQLLKLSDARFSFEGVRQPESCKLSLVEVTWNG